MDKEAAQLLENARAVIKKQADQISSLQKTASSLLHHKLAYDIAVRMDVDPEEFSDTVDQLLSKTPEDLQKRAEVLSVMDPKSVLDLGTPVTNKEGSSGASAHGGSFHSVSMRGEQSTRIGQQVIQHFISQNE